jgi:single-stranded-DNA-specific exonuclease
MTKLIRRPVPTENLQFTAEIHPVLQRIYAARGVIDHTAFDKSLETLLPYQSLHGINDAVIILTNALIQQKRILVLGDFDADGATSCALAVSALQAMGATQVSYLVPNRFEYGYGLTPEIVDVACHYQPDVLITVDNGITSHAGVVTAQAAGMQVIITDHHLPGETLPAADAIVNPNLVGDTFPSKNLAGVGVVFYVMLALRSHLRAMNWFQQQGIAEPNMGQFLDLVALGTIADVVPLDKNNRILAHQGLKRIQAGKARPGIKALLHVAKRNEATVVASDLAFAVAPRLNAAGRLDDMSLGITGLLATDMTRAQHIAQELDALNHERRLIETDMQEQAFTQLRQLAWDKLEACPVGLCLFQDDWHQGVIGILASRIKDKLHRPVVAFAAVNDNELKGSARSVTGVHIRDIFQAIDAQHPGLILKFGGHAMAAGITIPRSHFKEFSGAFAAEVAKHLNEDQLYHTLHTDGELQAADITVELAELLRDAEPWGQAFPEPLFDGIFTIIEQRLVGGKHLKLTLSLSGTNRPIAAIAFNINLDEWPNHRCQRIQGAYRLDINEFNGRRSVQLIFDFLQAI